MAPRLDSKKYQEELKKIQENMMLGYQYFQNNYDRFKRMYQFVCVSNLDIGDKQALAALGKPALSFNVLEAFISKLRARFMAQEPSINVKPAVGLIPSQMSPQFLDTIDILEAHLREAFQGPDSDRHRYQILTDVLVGGWGVARISTDYAGSRSFEQNFTIERCYPPAVVFDPSAKEIHKGDGNWCAEIIPFTEQEFKDEFGEEAMRGVTFSKTANAFNWSYTTQKQVKVANVVMYYKKKKKKVDIVRLSTGKTMDADRYPQFLLEWDLAGVMEQPPQIIDQRKSEVTKICLYTCCEDRVLRYEETDFEMLPLVFVDGNSVTAEDSTNNQLEQVTRSYIYNAIDAQKVKNFAGQSLAQELETMIMHKIMVSTQAIPEDKEFQRAYTNYQKPNTIVWNEFYKGNPDAKVTPPQIIPRTQTPSVIMETFVMMDKLIQMALGDYDAQVVMQSQAMSGVGQDKAMMNTSDAAGPWFIGFIAGQERIAQIMVNLIPKIWRTPRSIPIRKPDGSRDYRIINDQEQPNAIMMGYDPESMMVRIEPGPTIATQKQVAMKQITEVMKVSPIINEYFSTEGAPIIMDNMDFEGSDRAKAGFEPFMQNKKKSMAEQSQQQKQAQQIALQKLMAEAGASQATAQAKIMDSQTKAMQAHNQETQFVAEYMQQDQQNEREFKLDVGELVIKNKEADAEVMKTKLALQTAQVDQLLKAEQVDAENARTQVDMMVQLADHLHGREMDLESLELDKKSATKGGSKE